MSRGFLFLNVGTKYDDRLIVAVGSLRDFHSEPVHIMTDTYDNRGAKECIRRFNDVSIGIVSIPKKRNAAYVFKSSMWRHTPWDRTVFMDADTLTVGTVNELWTDEIILTTFGDWNTSGSIIGGRIRAWESICPDIVKKAFEKPWAAINTGVVGFERDAPILREWENLTAKKGGFICDEVAANLLYIKYELPTVDDRFNASPRFAAANANTVRCWHGHGSKHLESAMGIAWKKKAEELGIPIQ